MIRRYGPRVVGYGLLLALVIAAPHIIPEEKVTDTQLSYVGTFAIALLGLVILTGYTGQISLGHGAFMAIGAYVTANPVASTTACRTSSRCRSPGSWPGSLAFSSASLR